MKKVSWLALIPVALLLASLSTLPADPSAIAVRLLSAAGELLLAIAAMMFIMRMRQIDLSIFFLGSGILMTIADRNDALYSELGIGIHDATLIAGVIIGSLLLLLMSVFSWVPNGSEGSLHSFSGASVGLRMCSGLHFKWPWQQIYSLPLPKRIRDAECHGG